MLMYAYISTHFIIDVVQIIDQAALSQPTPPSFALPLPPKAKRQTSLPFKTTTADDVHDETSDELTHSVPQETTTDGTECAVSAETDAEITSTTNDANAKKQVPFLHIYVLKDFCVT